ncbi:hypothetical protein BaRGS_00021457 [Batillaria attramentaria]|uniref:ShKT domain-containing protein n=1 Tax=Batillaria attramentaria TaxID=370345 RepID=A0ABD0KJ76_9CAEN
MQFLNGRACESTPIDFTAHLFGQCDFCCRDVQCVKSHLAQPVTSQTTQTVTSLTTTTAVTSTPGTHLTTTAPHPPPGINSCYTSSCLQGDDPVTCTSGQWACGDDQFCQVVTYHDTATVRMRCTTISLAQAVCDPQHPHCRLAEDFLTLNCVRCCPDDTCVKGTISLMPSTLKQPSTTKQPTSNQLVSSQKPSTPMTTTDTPPSPVTSTQEQGGVRCENYHADDACENYKHAGLCTDNYIVGLCQRTCNACGVRDVHCVDTYAGNCSADFAGRCSENDVRQQCHKTCGSCGKN